MEDVYADSRSVTRDGVELVVTHHGGEGDRPVLMLHGWPDTARLWRNQIPSLVDSGFRVIAPDLRGFGRSAKPGAVESYRISESVADMAAILDDADVESVDLVGHDWGALVAWAFALRHPDRVRSLTALSVGHPSSFDSAGLAQLQASWYRLLFQFDVAEELLSGNDWAFFRRLTGGHPETHEWIANLSRPGGLTSSLAWYRANSHPRRLLAPRRPLPDCQAPTLGVWSDRDFALTERQMAESEKHVAAEWEYHRIEGASHWIPLDAPDQLNSLLVEWLARH